MVSVVAVAVGGVFLVVGLFILGRGVGEFRKVYHILTNDPVSVRDLPSRTGPVEVEGRARPADDHEPVRSLFTDTECLLYEYETQEYRSSGKHSRWKTIDEGMRGVPFLVEDDTGAVRVEPAGADLRFADHTIRVDAGDRPPDRVARYVAATDDVDPQDGSVDLGVAELDYGNDQKFIERRLDPGEDVYVYGAARRGSDTEWGSRLVDAVIEDGEAVPAFVVSDTSERDTAWRIGKRAVAMTLFGLAFVVAGGAVVVVSGL
jgi:hypothetical protein